MSVAAPTHEINLTRSRGREFSAIIALFVLTIRQHTHGRRLLVLGALYALPCILALTLRSLARPAPSDILEFALIFNLLPHGLAPLTALLYSAGVVQDEAEEQTLTYLLIRSIPRWALYVTKLLATICVTSVIVGLATLALYACIYFNSPELAGTIFPGRVARAIGIMTLAQVGYCSLFGFIGLLTRRSLITGVVYIVAIEGVLANIDFIARSATMVYYVRILLLRWLDLPAEVVTRFQRNWRIDLETVPSAGDCVQRVLVFSVVMILLAAVWFSRREFRVKTSEG
jgi:ABC-2 type transport system permease protein